MKLFATSNIEIVKCCHEYFGFPLPSALLAKRVIYTTLFTITGREKQKHKKNQTNNKNNDKKINLTNNLNYIHCHQVAIISISTDKNSEKIQTSDLSKHRLNCVDITRYYIYISQVFI